MTLTQRGLLTKAKQGHRNDKPWKMTEGKDPLGLTLPGLISEDCYCGNIYERPKRYADWRANPPLPQASRRKLGTTTTTKKKSSLAFPLHSPPPRSRHSGHSHFQRIFCFHCCCRWRRCRINRDGSSRQAKTLTVLALIVLASRATRRFYMFDSFRLAAEPDDSI